MWEFQTKVSTSFSIFSSFLLHNDVVRKVSTISLSWVSNYGTHIGIFLSSMVIHSLKNRRTEICSRYWMSPKWQDKRLIVIPSIRKLFMNVYFVSIFMYNFSCYFHLLQFFHQRCRQERERETEKYSTNWNAMKNNVISRRRWRWH